MREIENSIAALVKLECTWQRPNGHAAVLMGRPRSESLRTRQLGPALLPMSHFLCVCVVERVYVRVVCV